MNKTNVYARRKIIEPILCACGCGKSLNRYDERGREKRFHRDCFSPGRKLSYEVKNYLSKRALNLDRIESSLKKIKKVNQEVKEGKRKPGGYVNGRWIRQDGYVQVLRRAHPRANKYGYVFEHILIMEAFLGKYLEREEMVHHINRDRADNRIENLMLLSSQNEHQQLHSREDNRRDAFGRFSKFKGEVCYGRI